MDKPTRLISNFSINIQRDQEAKITPILEYLGLNIKKYGDITKYQRKVYELLYSYFTKNPSSFPSPHYKYILNKPCYDIDPNILYSIMVYVRKYYNTLGTNHLWNYDDAEGNFSPALAYRCINRNLEQENVLILAFMDLNLFKILENLVWVIDPADELEDSPLMNYCNPEDTDLSIHKPVIIGGDCDLVGTFLCSFWEREKYHELAKPHGIEWVRQNKRHNPSDCADFIDDEKDSDKTYCKKLIKSHPEFDAVEQIPWIGTFKTLIPMNKRFCLNADGMCPLSQTELQYLDENKIVQTSSNYCYSAEDFANYIYYNDFANKDPIDPNLFIYSDFKDMKEKLFKTNISDEIKENIIAKLHEINNQRPINIFTLLQRLPQCFYEIISVANICMSDVDDAMGFPDSNKALAYLYSLMDTLTTVELQSIASSDGITLETFRNMVENGYCIHRAGMLLFSIIINALYNFKKIFVGVDVSLPQTFYLDVDRAVTFHLDTHNKNGTLVPVGVDCLFSNNNRHFPGSLYLGVVNSASIYDSVFVKYIRTIPNPMENTWKRYYLETKELILRK